MNGRLYSAKHMDLKYHQPTFNYTESGILRNFNLEMICWQMGLIAFLIIDIFRGYL